MRVLARVVSFALALAACSVPRPEISVDIDGGWGADAGELVALGGVTPGCAGCVSTECQAASCDGTWCTWRDEADGTECASGVCVAGACVARTCGDGYVDPESTPRETCDDGNTVSGDGCSASCVPEVVTLEAGGASRVPTSVAVDGRGLGLAVWVAEAGDARELRAQRLSRVGNREGVPVVVARVAGLGSDVEIASAGRLEGWAVAWSAAGADRDGFGVRYALVSSAGAVGASVDVSGALGDQGGPAIAALEGGVAVAFVDRAVPMSHGGVGRVLVRRFGPTGAAIGGPEVLSTAEHPAGRPALLAQGAGLLAAWPEGPDPIAVAPDFQSRVTYRRWSAARWSAAEVLGADAGEGGALVSLAPLADGTAIASVQTTIPDPRGNVEQTVIEASRLGAVWSFSGPRAARAPVAAAAGTAYWVTAWDANERTPTIQLEDPSGRLDSADLQRLRDAFVGRSAGGVAMATAPRGIWVTWTDSVVGGRAVRAYFLPYENPCLLCGGETPACDGATGDCDECAVDADCPALVGATASCVSRVCEYECDPHLADCDGDRSCETDLRSDTAHCGECGNTCVGRPNSTGGTCSAGTCSLSCVPGYVSCDSSTVNGCETHVSGDAANCGACGADCTDDPNVSSATCSMGACGYTCDGGYASCTAASGCETHVAADDYNCGSCGTSCWGRPNSSKGTCSAGACDLTCYSWYDDCDGLLANGCETYYATDVENCGACDVSCLGRPNSTGATCSAGACNFACSGTYRHCDGSIANGCETNIATSATSCGGCGISCLNRANSTGGTCSSGTCNLACTGTWRDCDIAPSNGCETNSATSVSHCGACMNNCAGHTGVASATCASSACVYTCQAGRGDCTTAAGCETNTQTTTAHCGACGNNCAGHANVSSASCSSGACSYTCQAGFGNCTATAGCETDTRTTTAHCGACMNNCAGHTGVASATCSNSTCNYVCQAGWGNCSSGAGCETRLNTISHCGACNATCDWACGGTSCADATQVALGLWHTCFIGENGALFCWGLNGSGQLGTGNTTSSSTPVPVSGASSLVTSISAGVSHTCMVRNGGAQCWGANEFGQLGTGNTTPRTTPGTVSGQGSGVVEVAAGAYHACARRSNGQVWCWGLNSSGQLGNGTTTNSSSPVQVSGIGVVAGDPTATAIAVGNNHSCALLSNGTMRCWGLNSSGQLGNNQTTNRTTPVAALILTPITAISAGADHTCAVTNVSGASGRLFCWGDNTYGQIGDGTTGTDRPSPTQILSSGVSTIALGVVHSCARLTTGALRCWGHGSYGQVGDGGGVQRTTPVAVSGISNAQFIAAGGYHSCAIVPGTGSGGVLRCWGRNNNSQIGDGSTTNRLSPVTVTAPVAP